MKNIIRQKKNIDQTKFQYKRKSNFDEKTAKNSEIQNL